MLRYTFSIAFNEHEHDNLLEKGGRCTTQLAKSSVDPIFVELTAADVAVAIIKTQKL